MDAKFVADYAKVGTASCKKCKDKLPKGSFRLGKLVPNPFSQDAGDMKHWYHPKCLFTTFEKARATTKKIEDVDDVQGFDNLQDEDKKTIEELVEDLLSKKKTPTTSPVKQKVQANLQGLPVSPKKDLSPSTQPTNKNSPVKLKNTPVYMSENIDKEDPTVLEKENAFRTFRKLCAEISEESSYTAKTKILHDFISKGLSGNGFKGDLFILIKLFLPGIVKRIYNLKDKQLVKIFANIFNTNKDKMLEHLEQGDVAETIRVYFEDNQKVIPSKKSILSNHQVDEFLEELSYLSKEDDQQNLLAKFAVKCTGNDLKMIIRLIKHDLKINTGSKHILDALDNNAYAAFQASRDLHDVISRVCANYRASKSSDTKLGMKKSLSVRASLMTPVLPMLAEACRSVEMAMRKCPNGMFAEIKYDGERVQVHKNGNNFQYFSRSLKTVVAHKVQHFKDFIPTAFPGGDDLIIDSEVLLVDTKTGKQLPFGTLGVHKKAAFKDASVCLFVFDILHLNGENLMDKPFKERRRILETKMVEVKNHVMYSVNEFINDATSLKKKMNEVFCQGLEGLVLKDINSIYEPGKRHWLKVKKDYLNDGAMADSADLIVLGAYFGTGNKGGLMSVFLMGCYDPQSKKFCTVTKVGNGHDDNTIARLQKELSVTKINQDNSKVPSWINLNKSIVPDFIVTDPKTAPIWEITGAEFSQSSVHTAGGISIRFPRVTKIRDDKTWENATDLPRLIQLSKASKERSTFLDVDEEEEKPSSRKRNAASNDISPSKKPKISAKTNAAQSYGSSCLPNLFTGVTFMLDPEELEASMSKEDIAKLRRYLIAYDADVVDTLEKSQASYYLVLDKEKNKYCNDGNKLVTVDNVWKCIKQKKMLAAI